MYRLTLAAIDLEKIECPVIITALGIGQRSLHKSFKNGSELVASKFKHKYIIKSVRTIADVHQVDSDFEADRDFGPCIEIILTVPDVEQAVTENDDNDDVSFF